MTWLPLGYEVVIFEKADKPGGLMRSNIPSFRLPESVLYEEIDYILDMGVDIRYNTPVESMKALLDRASMRYSSARARLEERISIFPADTRRTVFISELIGWSRSRSDTRIRLANGC